MYNQEDYPLKYVSNIHIRHYLDKLFSMDIYESHVNFNTSDMKLLYYRTTPINGQLKKLMEYLNCKV